MWAFTQSHSDTPQGNADLCVTQVCNWALHTSWGHRILIQIIPIVSQSAHHGATAHLWWNKVRLGVDIACSRHLMNWGPFLLPLSPYTAYCRQKCWDFPFSQHGPFRGVFPCKASYWSPFDSSFPVFLLQKAHNPPSLHPNLHKVGSYFFHFSSKILYLIICYLRLVVHLAPQVLSHIQGHTHALLIFILDYKMVLPVL